MVRKKLSSYLGLLLAASMALAACTGGGTNTNGGGGGGGGGANPGTGGGQPTVKEPAFGGEMSFEVPADPDTLAPFWLTSAYAADVVDRVYGCGLLRISGATLQPEPCLAKEMPTVSDDQLTYTFKVREDVKFHDGTPLTAEHIVFSYDIIMSPDYAGSYRSTVAQIEHVKLIDKYTIEFKTKEIFAPFLFSSAGVYAMPKHLLEGVPIKDMPTWDGWMKPVGIGPWKYGEWRSGEYTLLHRNDTYFKHGNEGILGGKVGPWIDRLRIKVIPDTNTAIAALEAGEITYMTMVEPNEVPRLVEQHKDRLVAYEWDRLGYGYQTFNNDKFPTNIREVRQALSYGLNREAILAGVLNGAATMPAGFVPPIHWVYNPNLKGYNYDPAKAEELIKQAGFTKGADGIYQKDGQRLSVHYVGTSGSPIVEGVALASQADWGRIGVETKVDLVDFNTLLDRHLKPGDYHVTFSGLGFTTDPHTSFNAWHSSQILLDDRGVAQGGNRARYANSQVDALIDQARQVVDMEERKKLYWQAEEIIVNDAAANWIYVNLWTDLADKSIKGVVNINGWGMSYDEEWFVNEK